MTTLADAFVKIRPDAMGFEQDLTTKLTTAATIAGNKAGAEAGNRINDRLRTLNIPPINLKASPTEALAQIDRVKRQLDQIARSSPTASLRVNANEGLAEMEKFKVALELKSREAGEAGGRSASKGFNDGFSANTGIFAATAGFLASKMAIIGGAALTAAPLVVNLASQLARLSGLAIAAPSGLVAAAASMGVLKLATMGLGTAIKDGLSGNWAKFQQDLNGLPGGERAAASAIVNLRQRFMDLRNSVANSFFAGMTNEIKGLSNTILPVIERQLPNVASGMNSFARSILTAAQQAPFVKGLNDTLAGTAQMFHNAAGGGAALTQAFGTLLQAGAPVLARLGSGFTNLASQFDRFIQHAQATGQLTKWLNQAISTLDELGRIAKNAFGIIKDVLGASTADGTSFLDTIEKMTQKAKAFLDSAQGHKDLLNFFKALDDTGKAVSASLLPALKTVIDSFKNVGPSILTLLPVIANFVAALAPLLAMFTNITKVILADLTPQLNAVANWLKANPGAAKVLAIAIGTLVVSLKAMKAAAAVGKVFQDAAAGMKVMKDVCGGLGTAVKVLGSAIDGTKVKQLAATAVWVASKIALAAQAVATGIATAAQFVWDGALTAGAIAMGILLSPIVLIIAAVAVLAAAIFFIWKYHVALANAAVAAWHAIVNAAQFVANWFMTNIWPHIQAAIGAIGGAFQWLWLNIVVPVWHGIMNVIFAVWGFIYNSVFAPMIQFFTVTLPHAAALFAALVSAGWHAFMNDTIAVWNIVYANTINPMIIFFTVTLPHAAALFAALVSAGWHAFMNDTIAVWNSVYANTISPLINFFTVQIPHAASVFATAVSVWWHKFMNDVNTIWTFVYTSVIAPLINFFTVQIPEAAHQFVTLVTQHWETFKNNVNAAWQWVHANVIAPMVNVVTKDIPQAFETAVNGVKTAWDKIQAFCHDPIKFVIDTVYNNGIVKVWNFIASKVSLPALQPFTFAADGGYISGEGGPTDDKIPAMLSNGEYVVKASATKKYLPVIQAINGDVPMPTAGDIGIPYAQYYSRDANPGNLAHLHDGGMLNKLHHNGSEALMFDPNTLMKFAAGGPADIAKVQSIQSWLYQQNGKPYVMGAAGPSSWDCSGLVGAVRKLIEGQPPNGRIFDTTNEGGFFSPGFGGVNDLNVGWHGGAGGDGHTVGSIGGLNFEATPPHVLIGKTQMTPGNSFFEHKGHANLGGGSPFSDAGGGGGGFCLPNPVHAAVMAIYNSTLGNLLTGWMNGPLKGDTGYKPEARGAVNSFNAGIKAKIDALIPSQICIGGGGGGNDGALGDMAVETIAYNTAKAMGASKNVMMALFEAGFVESGFKNLQTAVDHDSLGFLQQRPSQGWPSPTNVATATHSFVSRAAGKSGSPGQIAQAVQGSAFPARYDQAASRAQAALRHFDPLGFSGGGMVSFDQGGPLQPGPTMVWNGTGRQETVSTGTDMDAVIDRLEKLIDAVEDVAPGVSAAMRGAGHGLLTSARKRG